MLDTKGEGIKRKEKKNTHCNTWYRNVQENIQKAMKSRTRILGSHSVHLDFPRGWLVLHIATVLYNLKFWSTQQLTALLLNLKLKKPYAHSKSHGYKIAILTIQFFDRSCCLKTVFIYNCSSRHYWSHHSVFGVFCFLKIVV